MSLRMRVETPETIRGETTAHVRRTIQAGCANSGKINPGADLSSTLQVGFIETFDISDRANCAAAETVGAPARVAVLNV